MMGEVPLQADLVTTRGEGGCVMAVNTAVSRAISRAAEGPPGVTSPPPLPRCQTSISPGQRRISPLFRPYFSLGFLRLIPPYLFPPLTLSSSSLITLHPSFFPVFPSPHILSLPLSVIHIFPFPSPFPPSSFSPPLPHASHLSSPV